MEGGGSQVDQETRTLHRGYPLLGVVVQPPPFSEWGYVHEEARAMRNRLPAGMINPADLARS